MDIRGLVAVDAVIIENLVLQQGLDAILRGTARRRCGSCAHAKNRHGRLRDCDLLRKLFHVLTASAALSMECNLSDLETWVEDLDGR
jgi:hypothetical protein